MVEGPVALMYDYFNERQYWSRYVQTNKSRDQAHMLINYRVRKLNMKCPVCSDPLWITNFTELDTPIGHPEVLLINYHCDVNHHDNVYEAIQLPMKPIATQPKGHEHDFYFG